MAKGKKQSLSTEELLQQALVPEDGQPYNVPGNWVWVNGKAAFGNMESTRPTGDFFKYIDIDAIDNKTQKVLEPKTIAVEEAPSRASRKVNEGDTLFSLVRPYLRNIAYIDSFYSECIASTGFYVCHPNKMYNPRYIYYLMTSEYVVNGLNAYMKGDNSPSIRKDDIENFPYPLPPLAEQQRIVHRIDNMFAKLDQAKELAKNALDSFETRKAAILHKAFTGELTAKWRVEHGMGMDSWENKELNEVAKFSAGYAFDSKSFTQEGYQVIRMGNLYNGILDLERNPVFIDPKVLGESLLNKSRIEKGDILLTLTGTKYKRDYGYAVLIDQDQILLLNQRIVALKPNKVDPIFLLYFLRSKLFRDVFFSNETGGVNQGNVSSKFVENIIMPYPSFHEQKQIVSILVNVMSKEDKTKELIDVIDQIDRMKKAILTRGFRAELGTNDPAEESSMELLIETLEKKINENETVNKHYPNKESFDVGKVSELVNKDLLNVLNQYGAKLTPLELYKKTEMDIEEFYAVLKEYVGIGDIIEERKNDGEVYLVAKR